MSLLWAGCELGTAAIVVEVRSARRWARMRRRVNGHERCSLWVRRAELAKEINAPHTNRDYLGETALAASLRATTELAETLDQAELVLLAVPSHTMRAQLAVIAPLARRRCDLSLRRQRHRKRHAQNPSRSHR